MLNIRKTVVVASAFSLGVVSMGAQAALITSGITFSVAAELVGTPADHTHYHSNSAGDYDAPPSKAEAGWFEGREELRGMSEYDITGISSGAPAYVSFNVYDTYGLDEQLVDSEFNPLDPDREREPAIFDIDVVSYAGNNAENLSDWGTSATGAVTTFSTSALNIGDTLSFEVSDLLDAAILAGSDSFGIRLQGAPSEYEPYGPSPAFTFDSFRLTTTNESTAIGGSTVPEPGTLSLLLLGLAGLVVRRKTA